jgi:hypothetical protein
MGKTARVEIFTKYGLIHMHRKHRCVPQPRGSTDTTPFGKRRGRGGSVKLDQKYLGVLLDKHLTGLEQVRAARKKAAKLTLDRRLYLDPTHFNSAECTRPSYSPRSRTQAQFGTSGVGMDSRAQKTRSNV